MNDDVLCEAVRDANRGLIDADLGGNVIKQRIARPGEGKSGGFRTIVLFKINDIAFFVYGFAKNKKGNITSDELKAFKILASEMLGYDKNELTAAIENGALTEVICNE